MVEECAVSPADGIYAYRGTYIYVEAELAHCTRVHCSDGESSSTHLSFAYVVLSASCYTNRQHISHVSLLSASSLSSYIVATC